VNELGQQMTINYLLGVFLFPFGTTLYFVAKIYLGRKSLSWPSVAGDVIYLNIEKRERSSKFPSISGVDYLCLPQIKYRYIVNNKEYHSKRIKFYTDMYYQIVARPDIAPELPFETNDNSVTVYYLPSMPMVSVLTPGITNSKDTFIVIGIVWFISIIIYACLSVLAKM